MLLHGILPPTLYASEPRSHQSAQGERGLAPTLLGSALLLVLPDVNYEIADRPGWSLRWPINPAFYVHEQWEFAVGLEPQWRFSPDSEWRLATFGQAAYFLTPAPMKRSELGFYAQLGYMSGEAPGPFGGLGIGIGGKGTIMGVSLRYQPSGDDQHLSLGTDLQLGRVIYALFTR